MFPGPAFVDGSTVQVPFADAPSESAQTSQELPQTLLQQKPSTQLPEEHWRFEVHDAPFALDAKQAPPLQ
jgi:hypothetical protein